MFGCWDGKPLAADEPGLLLDLPRVEGRLVEVYDWSPVDNVLGQLVGELNPFGLKQRQVVAVRVEVRVRRPAADAVALVESAEPLPLHLDFEDLLDLLAALDQAQVRPVRQALGT